MRHLAAFLYQALGHLFERSAPRYFTTKAAFITDRPGPAENAGCVAAAFAGAAGANDEDLSPPEPPTPAPEDHAPAGDGPVGGDGPMLGDPSVRLDSGA